MEEEDEEEERLDGEIADREGKTKLRFFREI